MLDPFVEKFALQIAAGYDDELDDMTRALLAALADFDDQRAWDPAKHPRDPDGKFRSLVARIANALSDWADGKGDKDPLKDFNREQLRKAAKARGITLRRGASEIEIKNAILDDVRKNNGGKSDKPKPVAKTAAAKKAAKPKEVAAPKPVDEYGSRQAILKSLLRGQRGATREDLGGGEDASVSWLDFPDGSRAVKKTYGRRGTRSAGMDAAELADAEELAPLVMVAVGTRAPAVVRIGKNSVAMEWVDGRDGYEVSRPGSRPSEDEIVASDDGVLLGLADVLMRNGDRHGANWMMTADGHLVGIDHGRAFRDTVNAGARGSSFGEHFHGVHRRQGWKPENPMSPEDMATIRQRLSDLKQVFARLGRQDWWQQMWDDFAEIEKRATGTRRRLAT